MLSQPHEDVIDRKVMTSQRHLTLNEQINDLCFLTATCGWYR